MKVPSSGQDGVISGEQILRSLQARIADAAPNHISGPHQEIQMDEAADTGIQDYVPALAEINARRSRVARND